MITELKSQEKSAYMAEAYAEAEKAYKEGEVPVGCVIVKDGKIISRAHNTVEKDGSILSHAEIKAIKIAEERAGKYLDGCDMFVTVEPCAMCSGAIVGARIGRLFYGASEEKTGCCGSLYSLTEDDRFFATVPTESGIMEKECKKLMTSFFKDRR